MGRLGAILSAFTGAALITLGGGSLFQNALAVAMLLVLVGLGTLRHHIAPVVRRRLVLAEGRAGRLPTRIPPLGDTLSDGRGRVC